MLLYPILTLLNLIKCKFLIGEYVISPSVSSLFGDDWNLRFCALMKVGALFIFSKFAKKTLYLKNT